jgi:hypothetical protein
MVIPRVLLAVFVSACGGPGGSPGDAGDAANPGELTIEIHRSFPFVDGDTHDDAHFVAVQDGDGAFALVTGSGGVYRVPITSNRYGIAIACVDPDFSIVEIVQQTVADGTTYRTACKGPPTTATLDVTVVNLAAGQRLRLRTQRALRTVSTNETTTLNVEPGTLELFGTLTDLNRNIVKLFRVPAIQVQPSAAITIDVAADGAAPELHPVTVAGTATVQTSVVRPYGGISLSTPIPLGPTPRYVVPPAALRQADDLYRIAVTGSSGVHTRTVKVPGPLSFQLPSALEAAPPMLIKTPFLRTRVTFSPTAPVLPIQSYIIDTSNIADETAPQTRDWYVLMSSAWVGGASSITYELPDLSAIPGFADVVLLDRQRLDTVITRTELTSLSAVDGAESTTTSAQGSVGEYCGDGVMQPVEVCEPGIDGESATCDSDCTPVECGDNVTNTTANEECDPPDGVTCSAECKLL